MHQNGDYHQLNQSFKNNAIFVLSTYVPHRVAVVQNFSSLEFIAIELSKEVESNDGIYIQYHTSHPESHDQLQKKKSK